MPISLFDDLKKSGFHSSILTTFSVDPAFYDANIQYRLRAFGCQNNLLMADAAMLQQSLEQLPEAFAQAGRKYLVASIPGPGCFHPKIMLRYGKSKVRLILGSANATSAAWGSNRELISTLEWSEGSDSPDNGAYLSLIAKAHDWLLRRLPPPLDPDLAYKLDLLTSQSPWLAGATGNEEAEALSDGSLLDLYLSDPSASLSIADRLIAQVEGEVERLTIVSPYWDDDLRALYRLHRDFGGPDMHIFLTLSDDARARQSTFPADALGAGVDLRFHPVGDTSRHRFLHAKLIVAQTREFDYVLYGSANCTTAALGSPGAAGEPGKPGINCEAAIFRRVACGTIDALLGLDYSVDVPLANIQAPEKRDPPPTGPVTFDAGRIERKGDRLIWSNPADISPMSASFLIADTRIPIECSPGFRPYARTSSLTAQATTVVRVVLADGRISRPVIVSNTDMLMAAAPHPVAGNLRRKLEAVLSGESDLIDLARDVHLIFEADEGRKRSARMFDSRPRDASISMLAGRDFDSPEAFREALALKADLQLGGIAHADSPALQLILQIVLRGIVQLESSASIDLRDAEGAETLAAGEDQDDVGDDDSGSSPETKAAMAQEVSQEALPPEAIEQHRATLLRSFDRFDRFVDTLAASESALDLDFVTRTLFMIYLMLYGCSHRYPVKGGTSELLIPFSAIGTRHQDEGFLTRAAKLVSRIWGRRFKEGLMARVVLDRELADLPTPILTLVILSRWILAAILAEARMAPGAKRFSRILEDQIPRLWQMTSAFAHADSAQVEAAVNQMAKHIGMDQLQALAIQATMRELAQAESGRFAAAAE
ncbi:MAG: hypothetical protein WDN44_09115 [Sphingomonas sp.]